jgi:hypothetical protein
MTGAFNGATSDGEELAKPARDKASVRRSSEHKDLVFIPPGYTSFPFTTGAIVWKGSRNSGNVHLY